MVQVILYENGTYEVNDIDPQHITQRLCGYNGLTGVSCQMYNCPKAKWKNYLMKLLSTKDIDKKIRELQKQKRTMEKLKEKLVKAIGEDGNNGI